MPKVIELTEETPQWIRFLARHDHLIVHTPQFRSFLARTFRQQTLYLGVLDNEEIALLLPAVSIDHTLFGRKIIATAYLEYGGFAGNPKEIPLVLEYLKETSASRVSFVEIRQGLETFDAPLKNHMIATTPYKRFLLPLGQTDVVWRGIQKHKRKAIKKAEADGILVRELQASDLDQLYSLYLRTMRSFGSPPYGPHFFSHFMDMKMGKIFGAFIDKQLVAALVGYCYQKRIHVIIAVSDDRFQINRPSDAVHWAFIKYGCENDYTFFDFGRTREGSGQHEYKEKFGAAMHPLHHYYLLFDRTEIPHIDPTDKKMQLAAAVWKHIPLTLTEKCGHWLREGLGI